MFLFGSTCVLYPPFYKLHGILCNPPIPFCNRRLVVDLSDYPFPSVMIQAFVTLTDLKHLLLLCITYHPLIYPRLRLAVSLSVICTINTHPRSFLALINNFLGCFDHPLKHNLLHLYSHLFVFLLQLLYFFNAQCYLTKTIIFCP